MWGARELVWALLCGNQWPADTLIGISGVIILAVWLALTALHTLTVCLSPHVVAHV